MPTTSQPSRKTDPRDTILLRVGLACCASVLFALSIPLLTGKVYTHIDLGGFHLPARAFYQDCLRNGDSFLWEPQVLCGHYIHGEGQGGFLHPLHYLLYRFLPLQVAFNLELLLCYPAILSGCYLLFRRWSMSRAAALFAAFLFAFSGFGILRAAHMHLVEMTVHLPWLLLAIDGAFTGRTPRQRAWSVIAVALLTASELLLGYPQFIWIIGLAEAAYTLALTFRHRRWGTPILLFLAKGIGFLIGAAQWLPSYDFLLNSDRIADADALRNYLSLHPLNLLQLLNPFLFEYGSFYGNLQEFTMYGGAVCAFLLVWALVRMPRLGGQRRLVVFLLAGSVLALLLAFGPYTGFHRLVNWIPLISLFKGPCRYLVLFFFATAAIAGIGFDQLQRACSRSLKRSAVAVAVAIALASWAFAVLAYGGVLDIALNGDLSTPPLLWWGPLATTACVVLVAGAAYRLRFALPLLFVLAALDQSLYGLHFLHWWSTPTTIERFAQRFPGPGDIGPYRVYSGRKPESNGWALAEYDMASGLAGVLPRRNLDYSGDAALRAAGVAYKEKPGARYYMNDHVTREPGRWIPVSDPVSRVYLAGSAIVSDSPARDIQTIDVATTALVEEAIGIRPGDGEVSLVTSRPGDVHVHVRAETPQLLILSESFHKGWHATSAVDNSVLPILRVNGDFMGVVVPTGEREIRFRFNPESFQVGVRWSGLGLGLLGIFAVALLFWPWPHGRTRTNTDDLSAKTECCRPPETQTPGR
ncbi:MAG: hypothetical protein AMXMBFR82_28740 [Candidatus Hydrogenedentota bacterium]